MGLFASQVPVNTPLKLRYNGGVSPVSLSPEGAKLLKSRTEILRITLTQHHLNSALVSCLRGCTDLLLHGTIWAPRNCLAQLMGFPGVLLLDSATETQCGFGNHLYLKFDRVKNHPLSSSRMQVLTQSKYPQATSFGVSCMQCDGKELQTLCWISSVHPALGVGEK